MTDIPRITIKELAHKIKGYGTPRFAIFLGAGASRQSGIITASEMIFHFRERIIAESCPENAKTDSEKDAWLSDQDWYKEAGSDYCKLFAKFEHKEMGRQRYIENIIEGREPSFGYVVLANLMANKYINTIITTNFDDLVYSACTTYTGIRPIVYAYGVMASEMRITSQRPKILKLHGDFLYSTLKNTNQETAVQDPNMERQIRQVLGEYGLIVVGYSGADNSVMKILWQISDKNDLYWCIRRGDEPNDKVKELLTAKGGFFIEIEGFDEMMNEIRRIIEFDVNKMIGSIRERQTQMIKQFKKFEPQYSAEILGEIVEAIKEPAAKEAESKEFQALDFFSQAYKTEQAGDFVAAIELYRRAIDLNPHYSYAYNNLGNLLSEDSAKYNEAEADYRKAIELNPTYADAYNNLGFLLSKDTARQHEAEAAYRQALALSPTDTVIYTNLGNLLYEDAARQAEAEAVYRKVIELNPNSAAAYNNLGNLLSEDTTRYAEAEAAYRKAIELGPGEVDAYYNLGALLSEDPSRYGEAEAVYRKVLELNPDSDATYKNLINLLRIQNRENEALPLAERALVLDSQNPNRLFPLISIHKKLGHESIAEQYAAQARALIKPDDWYSFACLESVSGNIDEAIENLKLAAQRDSFDRDWAKRDPDLERVRNDPRFKEIVGEDGVE